MQLRRMPRSFALVVRLTPPPLSPVARTRLQAPARRAPRARPSLRLAVSARPYAVRNPRDYGVTAPGDLVQVDTLDVRPRPGVTFKQFTAREVVSHWDRMETYRRTTSVPATHFLTTLQRRMPVPIRSIQVVGGSEFAAFEQACQQQDIRLFVLSPRSPKLNGAVERANRTHTEEFYELYTGELDLSTVRSAQRKWEYTSNYIRPHHALGYLSPAEFLAHHAAHRPPSHMS
jgi:putative transposase